MGILFGVIVTSLVGTWFIPTIIGWFKAKRQYRSLRKYRKRIDSFNDGKLDSNDIKQKLIKLKSDITHVFEKGKISNQQYGNLKNEISVLYQEVYNNEINSLNGKSSDNIKKEITYAYSKFRSL